MPQYTVQSIITQQYKKNKRNKKTRAQVAKHKLRRMLSEIVLFSHFLKINKEWLSPSGCYSKSLIRIDRNGKSQC